MNAEGLVELDGERGPQMEAAIKMKPTFYWRQNSRKK